MTVNNPVAQPLGDSAITITFGSERSPQLLHHVHAAARSLGSAGIPHVHDVVPGYVGLTVFYDPLGTTYREIAPQLVRECERVGQEPVARREKREHVIPVRYDGIDLESVATATGLSTNRVIAMHAARTYTVDLLGFVPGFAYLSELDPALQIPRRPQPRPRVAAGSVAIAGAQTAVYPLDTPGGWHIIGSTTTVMFDPTREPPALLSPGDSVRFERVS